MLDQFYTDMQTFLIIFILFCSAGCYGVYWLKEMLSYQKLRILKRK